MNKRHVSPTSTISATDPLHVSVFEALRQDIMRGVFLPGEKVPVSALARRYAVGLMPVREAVHRLAADDALTMTANRTVRVPDATQAQFEDTIKICAHLVADATLAALPRVCPDEALRLALSRIESATSDTATNTYPSAVEDFWHLIYVAARKPLLVECIESLQLQLGPMARVPFRTGGEALRFYLYEHRHLYGRLTEAIYSRDPATTRKFVLQIGDFLIIWFRLHHF